MSRHIRNEHRIRIAAPADKAFMFFTPAGEELWVAGWRPHVVRCYGWGLLPRPSTGHGVVARFAR